MDDTPLYLQPGRIGSLVLANRVVRAATSETMATPEGVVLDSYVELYRRLAEGGASLILTGHMYVDPRGQASPNQTGIHHDGVIPALRRATDAVHDAGGRIFAQLGHCGSQTKLSSIRPVAPSPVPNAMYGVQPEELIPEDIEALVRSFGEAARRAAAAGFDGIHIHGGNGYLISEFCSPHANTRTDDWGGDSERRSRFMFEVYGAVRAAVGDGFPVTARLAVEDSVPGGLQQEESLQRARILAERGIDGFETTYGVMRSYLENIRPYVAVQRAQAWRNLLLQRAWKPAGAEAYYRPFARAVKQATDLPVILVGGIRTTESMIDILASGDADFLAMARPFIREPDLVTQAGGWPNRNHGVRLVQHVPSTRRLRSPPLLAQQPSQRRRAHPQALLDQPASAMMAITEIPQSWSSKFATLSGIGHLRNRAFIRAFALHEIHYRTPDPVGCCCGGRAKSLIRIVKACG